MGCGSGVGKKVHMSNCSRVSFDFLSARVSGVSVARRVMRKEAFRSRPDGKGRGRRHGHVPGQGLSLATARLCRAHAQDTSAAVRSSSPAVVDHLQPRSRSKECDV